MGTWKQYTKVSLLWSLKPSSNGLIGSKKNHSTQLAVWLKIAKKNTGVTTITYEEAREGALIYGWIDGLVNSLDKTYYLQRMTPRRPKGMWSQINKDIVLNLIAEGHMKPTGMVQVEAAKKDGRWDRAYAGPATITAPDDLKAALADYPKARAAFEALSKTQRFAFLLRLQNTVTPEGRAKKISKYIALLRNGNGAQ